MKNNLTNKSIKTFRFKMFSILNLVIICIIFTFFAEFNLSNAKPPFTVKLEPIQIEGVGGLQSYVIGESNGDWLVIGGRLDGLHRRQPFASFDENGNNNQIIVINPKSKQKWTAPLNLIIQKLQEQLSSTNMEFYQVDDKLYIIGGYGYSNLKGDHITYPYLTIVKVPELIEAIKNNQQINSFFTHIEDNYFAVTGGYLNRIYDKFYLTGGQEFIGRYNPRGPDFGPGFIQNYTNSIKVFEVVENGNDISVNKIKTYTDTLNLHRRDYNVVPQIFPNGEEGATAFSGVFQINEDLPFLNSVDIKSNGYTVNNDFTQYYNHYHCAHIPLYSTTNNEMYNIFFGGIAQFYDSLGIMVEDKNVPFVKTIAVVTRDKNGLMNETKLDIEMPDYLGASAEFIPLSELQLFDNQVLKYDALDKDTNLVGYIYGGIKSSEQNIFFINDGSQSIANNIIYKVYLIKNNISSIEDSDNNNNMNQYLNELNISIENNTFNVTFNLEKNSDIKVFLHDLNGKEIDNISYKNLAKGKNTISNTFSNLNKNSIYFYSIQIHNQKLTKKVIFK